ncbi:MAG: TlpA family protein disulfide reductase [Chloroflexi bacterium]|nr:TlpA family protein disulfide reductase [Chloroflexota bacterium]
MTSTGLRVYSHICCNLCYNLIRKFESQMLDNKSPSRPGSLGLVMIGAGLMLLGFLSVVYLYNISRSLSAEFQVVPVEVDFDAPDQYFQDLSGALNSLRDFRGQVVLVNLWATWCPPCREEMPALQEFYEKYKNDGFVLIAINQEERREAVIPFVEEFGLTFPVWLDEDFQAGRNFKTISLPSSYVVDRSGRVRLMWIGGISRRNLEKFVPNLIQERR